MRKAQVSTNDARKTGYSDAKKESWNFTLGLIYKLTVITPNTQTRDKTVKLLGKNTRGKVTTLDLAMFLDMTQERHRQ